MWKKIGDALRSEEKIPFTSGVGRRQARKPCIQVDRPQYTVKGVVLGFQEQGPGSGHRGKARIAGQGQGAVHLVARGELHEEIFR